jgi:Bardet-Biedl syndrome 7 protein
MIELDSIPTVLHVPKNALGNRLLVGFSDGRVILFRINPMIMEGEVRVCIVCLSLPLAPPHSLTNICMFSCAVKQETLIESKDKLSTSSASAVTCLDTFDLYGDGKEELIVGRRDGTIQVYSMTLENNEFDGTDCQQLLYEHNFNESISCVFGGERERERDLFTAPFNA